LNPSRHAALFADRALAVRFETASRARAEAAAEATAALFPGLGACHEAVAGGAAVYAGPGSPFNAAKGVGLSVEVSAEDMERLEAFYRARGARPTLDVCPLAHPTLHARVAERGYAMRSFMNVFAWPVEAAPIGSATAGGIEVRRAGAEQAELWARTVAQGFDGADPPGEVSLRTHLARTRIPDVTCYIAWVGGEPVGAGAMRVREGLGHLMGTSVRAAFRNHGIHATLIRARLADAARAGCELVTVGASPGSGSQRNLERAGFRIAYTKASFTRD
jgi:hypothetical protein